MPVGRRARSIAIGVIAGAVSAMGPAGQAAATQGQTPVGNVKRVVFVGNNWAGTADILVPSFSKLPGARMSAVPAQLLPTNTTRFTLPTGV